MNKLRQTVEALRTKLDGLRKQVLKETPTRTIIIDPILEALGWDVRDPDEVQLEYPTVDGKSVDYALKINQKPMVLVEAKALGDPLNNVKDVTQVVGYASNDGIVWCILTNGISWKVYRSMEQCPAPDKLMFEVSLDPGETECLPFDQLVEQMWRFSRDEVAKGTLDALGEQTFTDGKVQKALDTILRDPPRQFLNLIKKVTGDSALSSQQVKDSLSRIEGQTRTKIQLPPVRPPSRPPSEKGHRGRKTEGLYDEGHHLEGQPQQAVALYRAIERFCLSLRPSEIDQQYQSKCVTFAQANRIFCSVHVLKGGLRVWLKLKYGRLDNPPPFARDVSQVGHWATGDLELDISDFSQIEAATRLIQQSFETSA
jgi:hypothetical protein